MTLEEEKMTVDSLLELLSGISESGYGSMEIKCLDNYLHRGEVIVDYCAKEVVFRGLILNFSITDRVAKFEQDIRDAAEKYFHGDSGIHK